MQNIKVSLKGKEAEGFVIPLGDVNLVFVKSKNGMIGCGAFDVMALEKFGYPAAKVKPKENSVKDIDDLLNGEIVAVNPSGEKAGVKTGMSGKEAAEIII
ncbi:MAG: YunC family protein [Methanomicrobiaceae archaeon]|nr:YunC family protein [Methanomicrobiaceae archaeon]